MWVHGVNGAETTKRLKLETDKKHTKNPKIKKQLFQIISTAKKIIKANTSVTKPCFLHLNIKTNV